MNETKVRVKWDELTARERDALVAEHVMGWAPFSKRSKYSGGATWVAPEGYHASYGSVSRFHVPCRHREMSFVFTPGTVASISGPVRPSTRARNCATSSPGPRTSSSALDTGNL